LGQSSPTSKSFATPFWNGAMQYRVQFLDGSADLIRELFTDARNAASAISLVVDWDWPPRAVTMRVLDTDGREVHSAIKGGTQS
jgi:hypothetical protein